ncbi:MAG: hypothetical protein CMO78_04455 [Verrucomicrobiales bacterium]|jgi:hypothetical protein|nr:hypothetical protein [Verrucomicrobiales bacterium]|tara:strand:- start:117 stop:293 length:177 start_codon:yes stop_codon:yes gene_type:complete
MSAGSKAKVQQPANAKLVTAAMADTFTAKEMQAIFEFSQTPTGKKLAKQMPAIMRESG